MTLLHIDSSILGDDSVSRRISAATVARLLADSPDQIVVHRDLATDPLPHLSGAHLSAMRGAEGDVATQIVKESDRDAAALEEFLSADTVVIGVAFYNFTIPSQLKAWIDRIVIAGRTFRYTDQGQPEGLVGDKRVILAIARGGFYGEDSPARPAEHAETYLRATFGFLGITPEVIVAEGILVGPRQREAAIASAQARIAAL